MSGWFVAYLKGDKVYIEGRIKAASGLPRMVSTYTTEIQVQNLPFSRLKQV
jgi:hypothetical protein